MFSRYNSTFNPFVLFECDVSHVLDESHLRHQLYKLQLAHHPDNHNGNNNKNLSASDINACYEILTNPLLRLQLLFYLLFGEDLSINESSTFHDDDFLDLIFNLEDRRQSGVQSQHDETVESILHEQFDCAYQILANSKGATEEGRASLRNTIEKISFLLKIQARS